MGEPRDTARRWLADVIRRIPGADEMWDNAPNDIAEAILSAPGVEVDTEARATATSGYSFQVSLRSRYATHAQVVIRLPARPIEGRDG